MKRHELFFWLIKVPIEAMIVFFAFFIARDIRYITDLIPRVHLPVQTISTDHLIWFAEVGTILFLILASIQGLYSMRIYQSKVQEFRDIIMTSLYWFFIFIAIVYLSLGFIYTIEIPRLIVLFTIFIATVGIILERFILGRVEQFLVKKGALKKTKILLILHDKNEEIIGALSNASIYEIIGYASQKSIDSIQNIPYIESIEDVIMNIREGRVDEVLLVQSDFSRDLIQEIFEFCRIYGVRYRYIANSFETTKINTEISFLGKIPVIEIKNIGLTPWGRIYKRIFDIFFSFFGLLFLSPFLLLVMAIISRDGHSPIYRSIRVGKDGKTFRMYKFRSMTVNAEREKDALLQKNERKDGPLFKIEDDPRITAFGKWIRKLDIDELPQLYNVFIGNMSLIGPRPHLPDEVKLYKEYQKRVLTLKPGITGMAQSHGRHENTFDDEVRLDTFYIENWSLLLDVKIIIKTLAIVLARKGR